MEGYTKARILLCMMAGVYIRCCVPCPAIDAGWMKVKEGADGVQTIGKSTHKHFVCEWLCWCVHLIADVWCLRLSLHDGNDDQSCRKHHNVEITFCLWWIPFYNITSFHIM